MIVTIDGPAGAGKSTVARQLAARLGFDFLDTGAMYRAATLVCLRREVDLGDPAAVTKCACAVRLEFSGDRILADGLDVSTEIRSTEVTSQSQFIAGNASVRSHMVERQRELASSGNVVTEGRDQGTVAFPQAEFKFFVTASPEVRARRRQGDLEARGERVSLQDLITQQTERDERDATRAVGPLKPAVDAIVIDTSELPLPEVVALMENRVLGR